MSWIKPLDFNLVESYFYICSILSWLNELLIKTIFNDLIEKSVCFIKAFQNLICHKFSIFKSLILYIYIKIIISIQDTIFFNI